jgi:peptidoglycan-associated lipoprotein
MKLVSKQLSLVLAGAALVFAGCTKKPSRPDPSQTAIGQQGSGTSTGAVTNANFDPNAGALPVRDSMFDAAGQNRSALQAQTIYFDFDQSAIKPGEREKLKTAKEYLEKNPTHRLILEGHADWRGTAEYNLSLGDRRASAAKKYLVTLGVAATRLETLSKGSLEAAKNADDATMAKDRRVDLVVVDPAAAGGAAPAMAKPPM